MAAAGVLTATDSFAKKKRGKKKRRRKDRKRCEAKAIGELCTSAKECCGTTTGLSCATPSEDESLPVCCGTAGVACSGDAQCCAGFFCSPDDVCVVQA